MNYISEKLLLVALFFNIYNYIHKWSIGQIMDTTHRIHNILFTCNTAQYVTSWNSSSRHTLSTTSF